MRKSKPLKCQRLYNGLTRTSRKRGTKNRQCAKCNRAVKHWRWERHQTRHADR